MERDKTFDSYELALRLEKARSSTGKTQQEVADDLGINRNQIKVWECGTREIKAKDLFTLSKYYGVSVDYLLGLTECASSNTDLRAVCDYTGLSEKAVASLRFTKELELGNGELLKEYAALPIEQAEEKFGTICETDTISLLIENDASFCVLSFMSNYLLSRPDESKSFAIDDEGNIVEYTNSPYLKDVYSTPVVDFLGRQPEIIATNKVSAVLERILFDEIEKGLREAKAFLIAKNEE